MSIARLRARKPQRTEQELWREYANRKQEWQRKNPNASQMQYEQMIAALTKELGI